MKIDNIEKTISLKKVEDPIRIFGFVSFEAARNFSVDLLKDSYEFNQVSVSCVFERKIVDVDKRIDQPIANIVQGMIYVEFLYNAQNEHDKEHLLKVLRSHVFNIVEVQEG